MVLVAHVVVAHVVVGLAAQQRGVFTPVLKNRQTNFYLVFSVFKRNNKTQPAGAALPVTALCFPSFTLPLRWSKEHGEMLEG